VYVRYVIEEDSESEAEEQEEQEQKNKVSNLLYTPLPCSVVLFVALSGIFLHFL